MQHPGDIRRVQRTTVLLILLIGIAWLAAGAGAAAPVRGAVTTTSPFSNPQVLTTVTPPPVCQAPCECLSTADAQARWGAGGYTQCSQTPCYQYSTEVGSIKFYCYQQQKVTTAVIGNIPPVTTTLVPVINKVPVVTTTTIKQISIPAEFTKDSDGDGIADAIDNCPHAANPGQTNTDPDRWGNICDNCAVIANDDQTDSDGDCEAFKQNPYYWDAEKQWFMNSPPCGDACDTCPGFDNTVDYDKDGVPDGCDECPQIPDNGKDTDNDGFGDSCDNCPTIWSPSQDDHDNDKIGDACDCHDKYQGPYEQAADCGKKTITDSKGNAHSDGGCPDQICSACPSISQSLPVNFTWTNWRGINWMTPVKDQGSCGGCWAFAAVGSMEALHNIRSDYQAQPLDLSEQWLISGHPGMGGSCLGGSVQRALQDIQSNGIREEYYSSWESGICIKSDNSCHPYCNAAPEPSWGIKRACAKPFWRYSGGFAKSEKIWRIDGFGSIGYGEVDEVKRAIACRGPLAASSVYWGHAIVLVGWDDTIVEGSSPAGVWIYKNSWGTNGGEGLMKGNTFIPPGYGFIPYTGSPYSDIVPPTNQPEGVVIPTGHMGSLATVSHPKYIDNIPEP